MTHFAITYFRKGFAYYWHTHRRLLDGIAKLDEAALRLDRGYSRGSIHNTLVHLLDADRNYRVVLETGMRPGSLDPASLPDLAALQAAFEQEQAAWQTWLESLTGEDMEATLSYTTRTGISFLAPRWHFMQQVLLHGMQHHTELAQALTEQGQSPGDLDYIFFV